MAIDNIPNLAWLKTAPPLQKRRAAAVGKWHSACPEVRLYCSKVDGEKTLPPAGKLCNPCLRASRRPHGRGKTVTVAKGWGLVTNKEESMEITKRRLEDIVPYAGNAKKHDKRQISNVAESIKQYGFVQPIVIDRDGVIVIGHCRSLAAKKLGMEEVPCVCVDDLTPEQVNALRLVDNKSNESDWDFDLLADELPGLDLSAFDFDWGLRDELDTSVVEDNYDPVLPAEPKSKLGDVYQLGDHRLMCGDSTSLTDVQKLVGGGTNGFAAHRPPIQCGLSGHRRED
nr:MAG TPA: ParB protein [Caudoviricetes sp.]